MISINSLQVEAAKQITVENVASLPAEELLGYLASLHMASEDIPIAVQGALVSLEVGRLLQAAEHNTSKYGAFIAAVKPWSLQTDSVFDPLDPQTWVLSSLTALSERARCDWFLSTVFAKFFVPMVDAGAPKMAQVLAFSEAFIKAWETDDEVEAGDHTMGIMMLALRCFRFMEIVASFDMDKIISSDDAWDTLSFMSKLGQGSQGTSVDVLVATSVAEDAFYKRRLDDLMGFKAAILSHGFGIKRDMTLLQCMDGGFTEVEILKECLMNVCIYTIELDPKFTDRIVPLALETTKAVLRSGIDEFEKTDGEQSKAIMKKLQMLSSEASLVFSLDGEISELCEAISVKAGENAKRSEMDECIMLCDLMAGTADDDELLGIIKGKISPWWAKHVGFELSLENNKGMESTLRAQQRLICAEAPKLDASCYELDQETPFLDAAEMVAYWVRYGHDARRITDRWVAVRALKLCMLRFEALAPTLDKRVTLDEADDFKKFSDVRRHAKALLAMVEYADIEQPVTEHVELICHLLKDAADTEKLVMHEATKSKIQAVASALADLSDIAKGATNKASWLQDFPAIGNFDDLTTHYNQTLAKQDAKDLISKRDALHEAALQ